MAKVIGRKVPLLELTLSEAMILKRHLTTDRERKVEDMEAMKKRIAERGDTVVVGGRTFSRKEWVHEDEEDIAEMDSIISALKEIKHRLWVDANRPGSKRGGVSHV